MTLDPRPARSDLTSRECAKLICATLAGARFSAYLTMAPIRRTLSVSALCGAPGFDAAHALAELEAVTKELQAMDPDVRARVMLLGATLGGLIGGLREQSTDDAVDAAVQWVLETDDVWRELENTKAGELPLPSFFNDMPEFDMRIRKS